MSVCVTSLEKGKPGCCKHRNGSFMVLLLKHNRQEIVMRTSAETETLFSNLYYRIRANVRYLEIYLIFPILLITSK